MEENGDRAVTTGFSTVEPDLVKHHTVEWGGWRLAWRELKCSRDLRIEARIWEVRKLLTIMYTVLLA